MPRKRRKLAARTKTGRISRAYQADAKDNGTPECQAKRYALVGDADPALAVWAPGILRAHESITREQYDAGTEYAGLHAAVYGTVWGRGGDGPTPSDARLKRLKDRLQHRESVMSIPQREAVLQLVAQNYLPSWFFQLRFGRELIPEDIVERDLLLGGLNALAGDKTRAAAA